MLKPAICYKEAIENALKEYFYSDDMMFYQMVNWQAIQITELIIILPAPTTLEHLALTEEIQLWEKNCLTFWKN